jgi:predicted transcriptional regulator
VGQTYVYHSVNAPAQIRTSALRELINAFFNGSAVNAASSLIGLSRKLSPDEAAELQRAIDRAREKR